MHNIQLLNDLTAIDTAIARGLIKTDLSVPAIWALRVTIKSLMSGIIDRGDETSVNEAAKFIDEMKRQYR